MRPETAARAEAGSPAPDRWSSTTNRRRASGGFALIAALAVLVVLGSTGAIMLRLSAQQQAGSTAALIGLRATWAARSGIEWALHEAVATGDCPSASTDLNLTEGVLAGFDVTVQCTATRHFEGSDERVSLSIRSGATFGTLGTRDFTYREMSAAAIL